MPITATVLKADGGNLKKVLVDIDQEIKRNRE